MKGGKEMKTLKIKVETVPNHEVRIYHTDRVVVGTTERFKTPADCNPDSFTGTGKSKKKKELAKKIFKIQGVSEVRVCEVIIHDRYKVSIERSGVFRWEEIEHQVKETIKEYFTE